MHISSMGFSYIVMLTAFYVDDGKSLPVWRDFPHSTYWLLPALVGIPLIVLAIVRYHYRAGQPVNHAHLKLDHGPLPSPARNCSGCGSGEARFHLKPAFRRRFSGAIEGRGERSRIKGFNSVQSQPSTLNPAS